MSHLRSWKSPSEPEGNHFGSQKPQEHSPELPETSLWCTPVFHLPATAIIHICQFCLFGMICRLPADPLQIHCISNKHALHVLTVAKQNDLSWFSRIRTLCLQYSLPHPLTFLNSPPTKMKYKNIIKSKVMDSWERKLRNDEVSKAVIQ